MNNTIIVPLLLERYYALNVPPPIQPYQKTCECEQGGLQYWQHISLLPVQITAIVEPLLLWQLPEAQTIRRGMSRLTLTSSFTVQLSVIERTVTDAYIGFCRKTGTYLLTHYEIGLWFIAHCTLCHRLIHAHHLPEEHYGCL